MPHVAVPAVSIRVHHRQRVARRSRRWTNRRALTWEVRWTERGRRGRRGRRGARECRSQCRCGPLAVADLAHINGGSRVAIVAPDSCEVVHLLVRTNRDTHSRFECDMKCLGGFDTTGWSVVVYILWSLGRTASRLASLRTGRLRCRSCRLVQCTANWVLRSTPPSSNRRAECRQGPSRR